MQKKMKKRIIAILMYTILFIYLSIPIYAAQQELNINKVNIVAINSLSGTTQYPWKTATEFPFSLVSYPSNTIAYFYIVATLDAIPESGKVLVWTFDLKNAAETQNIARSKVGFVQDSFISSSQTATTLANYNYDQYVLATTQQKMSDDTIRYTVTTELINPTSKNIIWNIGTLGLANTSSSVRFVMKMHIYDSVDDAAGSGTTPEEMRDVLSDWGENELIPGVQDAVQSGVTSGMEAALEDEKQQASSGAQGGLDELAGALSGVTEDITQAKQSFETLGSALSYSGTSASLTFPAMTVPFLGTISEAQPINLTEQIDNIMPPTLLLIIRCALSIGIVSYPIFELITQLRKLLDKG